MSFNPCWKYWMIVIGQKNNYWQPEIMNRCREGVQLVFHKLRKVLKQKGVKEMNSIGTEFNPDIHEAITEIPAPSPDLKGKVLDVVETGYYLNDKIIRFAKVVVGK